MIKEFTTNGTLEFTYCILFCLGMFLFRTYVDRKDEKEAKLKELRRKRRGIHGSKWTDS